MCHFSSYWGGGVPAIRDIIYCVFKTWKRGTRPLCSLQQESWKTFFPPFPPVLLHFHLPDGGCALTFAGINLLVYLDFPSLICLNEINGHSCGQIYPKLELSLLGIPANRAHPKRDSTNSNNRLNNTILGTWSINHCKYGEECTRPRYTAVLIL